MFLALHENLLVFPRLSFGSLSRVVFSKYLDKFFLCHSCRNMSRVFPILKYLLDASCYLTCGLVCDALVTRGDGETEDRSVTERNVTYSSHASL